MLAVRFDNHNIGDCHGKRQRQTDTRSFDVVSMLKAAASNPEYVLDDGFRMGLTRIVGLLQASLSQDLNEAWNLLKVLHAAVSNRDYVPNAHFRLVLNDMILLVEDRICDELDSK